jgi:hypothetical protein
MFPTCFGARNKSRAEVITPRRDAPNAPRQMGLPTATHGMEAAGDAMPCPLGDRIEIVLRELGGFIWIQITILIIFIRVLLSSIATGWRYQRRRDA